MNENDIDNIIKEAIDKTRFENITDIEKYIQIADVYLKFNRFQNAIDYFDKIIEIDPNIPEAYLYRGISKEGLNRHEEALKDYNKSVEVDDKYVRGYLTRAIITNNHFHNYEEAMKDINKALEIDKEDPLAKILTKVFTEEHNKKQF
ncbi:hypothetical protein R4J17_00020 [Brachyspira intermedia]|uniref:tetratricopeptide repeat protein n=1 Tax=Brachyspira intermedia TaxID=84377 RepID=UPI0030077FF1